MNPLKQLAGQTAVYGLSSVIARVLNFLLVPFYTRIFTDTAEYGIVNELYAYVAFVIIILTYGMETAFFRYSARSSNQKLVYSTTLASVSLTSLLFIVAVVVFYQDIAQIIGYGENSSFVLLLGLVLGADALVAIPFANLRYRGKSVKFALIKLLNIVINIVFNLLFLLVLPWMYKNGIRGWLIEILYDPEFRVGYVFLSNFLASLVTLAIFAGEILKIRYGFSAALFRSMINYGMPLLIAGLAGTVNEFLDRILLRYRLPENVNALEQIGIYGANVKIAVLMMLFIQMFRFAFEPFIFSHEKNKSGPKIYADVMYYFVTAGILVFLIITLYIDIFKHIIDPGYHEGVRVVPVILGGYLMLGIYYNLSVWYKLKEKTVYGALFAVCGAVITIAVNWIFIPVYGYMASAWGHLLAYSGMVVISFAIGRKVYPVPYKLKEIIFIILAGVAVYFISTVTRGENAVLKYTANTLILFIFAGFVIYRERNFIKELFGIK